MSSFSNNASNINIKQYLEELNNCIDKWFKENFPKEYDQGEFKPCCTDQELEVLLHAINIFKTNIEKYNDEEVAKGIIVYYYVSIVLPYYMAHQADQKFVSARVANDTLSGFYSFIMFGKDNIHNYVMDDDGVIYEVYKKLINIDENAYLQIEDTETMELFYKDIDGKIFKKNKNYNNSMVYTNKLVKKPKNYFNCLDLFYGSKANARRIVDMITISDTDWASEIRRLLMNFNAEPFTGGKKRTNKKTTNKRTNKRKNTNKKRINKKKTNKTTRIQNT